MTPAKENRSVPEAARNPKKEPVAGGPALFGNEGRDEQIRLAEHRMLAAANSAGREACRQAQQAGCDTDIAMERWSTTFEYVAIAAEAAAAKAAGYDSWGAFEMAQLEEDLDLQNLLSSCCSGADAS